VAVLDRGDAPRRVALAVAQTLDFVDDRNLRIARQNEIAMQRMRQPAFHSAARGDHCLADDLPAEHALPARLRAGAAKQIFLELFDIEDRQKINQAFRHSPCSDLRRGLRAFVRFRPSENPATTRPERAFRTALEAIFH